MNRKRSLSTVLWMAFAEADNRYLDLFRVGYVLGLLGFLVLACAAAWRGEPWDPVAFGMGFGSILFGGGVGVGLRGRLEDGKSNDDCPPGFDPGAMPGPGVVETLGTFETRDP